LVKILPSAGSTSPYVILVSLQRVTKLLPVYAWVMVVGPIAQGKSERSRASFATKSLRTILTRCSKMGKASNYGHMTRERRCWIRTTLLMSRFALVGFGLCKVVLLGRLRVAMDYLRWAGFLLVNAMAACKYRVAINKKRGSRRNGK